MPNPPPDWLKEHIVLDAYDKAMDNEATVEQLEARTKEAIRVGALAHWAEFEDIKRLEAIALIITGQRPIENPNQLPLFP
jgi:hypothetical protein